MAGTSYLEINFPNLEDSKSNAQKTADRINDYIGEINKYVSGKLSGLPGTDSYGYVSSAKSIASAKISELTNKAERFSAYKTSIDTFISDSRQADSEVAKKIETVADEAIEKKGFLANLGSTIYDFFCVDLANSNAFTRKVAELVRNVTQSVSNLLDGIKDWFKYGEGKYILNIALSVVAVALSFASTVKECFIAVGAIAAVFATGGIAWPLVIPAVIHLATAVAGIISTATLMIDSVYTVYGNVKAMKLHKEGKVNEARYYGNIDGLEALYERTDFGDAEMNKQLAEEAKNHERLKDLSGFINSAGSIASLGIKKDFRYTATKTGGVELGYKEVGTDFSYANIKKNLMREVGFRYKKVEVTLDDGTTVNKYVQKLTKGYSLKKWDSPKDIKKSIEKVTDSIEAVTEYLNDPSLEGYGKAVDKTVKALGTTGNLFGTLDKYVHAASDLIVKPLEMCLGV